MVVLFLMKGGLERSPSFLVLWVGFMHFSFQEMFYDFYHLCFFFH